MPRPARELVEGGYYHVVSRGVEQRDVFLDDVDRRAFVQLLGEVVARRDWSCLAYCLMGNHYHLLVRTPAPDLPLGMHQLNGTYARGFNERHRRVGHLFQDRYKSKRIRREAHLWATARYVVMNPVRAGVCDRPGDWPWSSYRAVAGPGPPGLVAVGALRDLFEAAFGRGGKPSAERLTRFVADGGASSMPRAASMPRPVAGSSAP